MKRVMFFVAGIIASFGFTSIAYAAPTVTVTSPNGGENFTVGQTVNIAWASTNTDKVSIGWSIGPGSLNWIATNIPNTGSYSWNVNVGNTTNTQFKIQVTAYQTGVGSATDQSNNYFTVVKTVTNPPTITSTNAKAAASFEMDAGGQATINGSGLISGSSVTIGGLRAVITATQASGAALSVMVPSALLPGQTYPLYITNSNGTSNIVQIKILSSLSTPTVMVTAPNGGEVVSAQDSVVVKYSTSNLPAATLLTAYLYSPVYGDVTSNVVVGPASGTGTDSLLIALSKVSNIVPGQYKINLCALSVDNPSVPGKPLCDLSDNYFTISALATTSTITVTAPNGGEVWQLGSTHTIKWTPYDPSTGINVSGIVVAYLEKKDASGNFITVGQVFPDGKASIHWAGSLDQRFGNYPVPGTYYIRVVNNQTGASDRSDHPFQLVASNTLTADLKVNGTDGPIAIPAAGADYAVSWVSNAESCGIWNDGLPTNLLNYQQNLPARGSMVMRLAPSASLLQLNCGSTVSMEGTAHDRITLTALPATATTGLPDITVTTIGAQRMVNSGFPNTDAMNFTILVKNNGGDTTTPFTVIVSSVPDDLYPTGYRASNVVLGGMKGGETKSVFINGSYLIPSGRVFSGMMTAVADQANNIAESEEGNNTLQRQILMQTLLDDATRTQLTDLQRQLASTTVVATPTPITSNVLVVSPNGGEVLNWSSSHLVSWKVSAGISKVSVGIYKNDASYRWIVTDLPANITSYNWTPSSVIPQSDATLGAVFKVYVLGYKTGGGNTDDKSDTPFSVVAPSVQATPPTTPVLRDVDPDGTSPACTILSQNLRYRSRDAFTNNEVTDLQDFLITKGYIGGEPTGFFGLQTLAAVKMFQTMNGIEPTGFVGPVTRAKINAQCATGGVTTPSMNISQTSTSTAASTGSVQDLQGQVNALLKQIQALQQQLGTTR